MLHGDIKINGYALGNWSAVRGDSVDRNGNHLYDCTLIYRDIQGYLNKAQFQVKHQYGAGALQLAAEVIRIGEDFLKRTDFPVGLE